MGRGGGGVSGPVKGRCAGAEGKETAAGGEANQHTQRVVTEGEKLNTTDFADTLTADCVAQDVSVTSPVNNLNS